MKESNEVELDPDLRAVESQLRLLKPRAAKLGPSGIAASTYAASRNPIWGYAITWVSGVAVGCFAMATLPGSPTENQEPATATSISKSTEAAETNLAQQNPVKDTQTKSQERASFSNPMAQRIESIVEAKSTRHRLLLSSHLRDTLARASPLSRTHTRAADDAPRLPTQSSPKTRQQLMSELLDSHSL